jgi:hypothetical protein
MLVTRNLHFNSILNVKEKNATVTKLCMHARVRACETLGSFLYMTFYLCFVFNFFVEFFMRVIREHLEEGGGELLVVLCSLRNVDMCFKKC